MGRILSEQLVGPDDPIFSTGPGVFSRLASNPSAKTLAENIAGATPVTSSAAAEQVDELEDRRNQMGKFKHQTQQFGE